MDENVKADAIPADAGEDGLAPSVRRRWPAYRIGAAFIVLMIVLFVAAVGGMVFTGKPDAAALARRLDLREKNSCGDRTVRFRPAPGARSETVFAVPSTWHHARQCLVDLLAATRDKPPSAPIYDFIYAQVLNVLSRPAVRFYAVGSDKRLTLADVTDASGNLDLTRFDRAVYTNSHGVAYNAMSQVDLGTWLMLASYTLARKSIAAQEQAAYEALGDAVLSVVTDPVDVGGLKSRHGCELKPQSQCSFFHAITNPERKTSTAGGTLNKDLQVVRDLYRVAGRLKRLDELSPAPGRLATARRFEEAAIEGLNQLVYASGHVKPGDPPNLFDYIPKAVDGTPVENSWVYYAINPDSDRPGYFIQEARYKNCGYHIHIMNLLHAIFTGVGAESDLSGFTATNPALGKSIVDFILASYELKLADGLYVDSPTAGDGDFSACKKGHRPGLSHHVIDDFRAM